MDGDGAVPFASAPPSPRDALTIARILKVDHAGEYGAIRIYSAQIWVASRLCPDAIPALAQMLADERAHCTAFRTAMPERGARPCRAMWLWSGGGWLLGFTTALLGRPGVWACTAAVEAAVHGHMDEQLRFLGPRDAGLHATIAAIRDEELAHLRHAEANLGAPGPALRLLSAAIGQVTHVLIWLSTWGDSSRMARDLREAR